MRRTAFGAAAILIMAVPGYAWAACGADTPTAAGVIGAAGPSVHFEKTDIDAPGCPNETPTCRARAFVVPGDVVALSGTQGDLVCAAFVNTHGTTTTGWLPRSAVVPSAGPFTRTNADWAGKWFTAYDQSITIAPAAKGEVAVSGEALYGAHDPERVRRGGVNMGNIDARTRPEGDMLSFTMGTDKTLRYDEGDATDCRLRMMRVGIYLVVTDTGNCGGHNVTFSGLYRRKG